MFLYGSCSIPPDKCPNKSLNRPNSSFTIHFQQKWLIASYVSSNSLAYTLRCRLKPGFGRKIPSVTNCTYMSQYYIASYLTMSRPIIEPQTSQRLFHLSYPIARLINFFVAKGGSSMTNLSASIHLNFLHIDFDVCMKTRGVLHCHTSQ